jgi:hypothetical protein
VLSSKARDTFRHVTEPAGHALAKAGITANSLTAVGLAGSLGAGAHNAPGQPQALIHNIRCRRTHKSC